MNPSLITYMAIVVLVVVVMMVTRVMVFMMFIPVEVMIVTAGVTLTVAV